MRKKETVMNRKIFLCGYVLFALSLNASEIKVKKESKRSHAYILSADSILLDLDLLWYEESELLKTERSRSAEAGTAKKKAVSIPLDASQIEELNALLIMANQQDTKPLEDHLKNLVGLETRTLTGVQQDSSEGKVVLGIELINRLYTNAETCKLKILYPHLHQIFIQLITHQDAIKAFTYKPAFLKELTLHKDFLSASVSVLSQDDQEFMRSQLYEDISIWGVPTCLSVSPSGAYVMTAGATDKRGFFSTLSIGQTKQFKKIELDEPIEHLIWLNATHIVIGMQKSIKLWDVATDQDITPDSLTKEFHDVDKIWAIALSKDASHLAVGVDDKILLVHLKNRQVRVLSTQSSEKKDKAAKKKGFSKLCFVGDDKLLVEMKTSGEVVFYSLDNGICVAREKGDGTEIQHHYRNGTSLITISAGNEACIWDCQRESQKRLVKKGKIIHNTLTFVPLGQQYEAVQDHPVRPYDTGSISFIEDMPFLTGIGIADVLMVKSDGTFHVTTSSKKDLELPASDQPKYVCTTYDGAYLFALGSHNTLRLWHYFNPELKGYLSTKLSLAQGLCLKVVIDWIRLHLVNKTGADFDHSCLRQPHLRKLFMTLDETFRSLFEYAFPEMCPPDEDRSSSSTSVLSKSSPMLEARSSRLGKFFSLRRTNSGKLQGSGDSPRSHGGPERKSSHSGVVTALPTQLLKAVSTENLKGSPRKERSESPDTTRRKTAEDSPRRRVSADTRRSTKGHEDLERSIVQGKESPDHTAPKADVKKRIPALALSGEKLQRASSDKRRELDKEPNRLSLSQGTIATAHQTQTKIQPVSGIDEIEGDSKRRPGADLPGVLESSVDDDGDAGWSTLSRHGDDVVKVSLQSARKSSITSSSGLRTSMRSVVSAAEARQADSKVQDQQKDEQSGSGSETAEELIVTMSASDQELVEARVETTEKPFQSDTVVCSDVSFIAADSSQNVQSLYSSGMTSFQEGRYSEAFSHFVIINAQVEDKRLQVLSSYWLGELYFHGWGTGCDYEMALSHFEKVTRQDFDLSLKAAAFSRLGQMNYYGNQVKASLTRAQDYLGRALEIRELPYHLKLLTLFLMRKLFCKTFGQANAFVTQHENALVELCARKDTKEPDKYLRRLYMGRLEADRGNDEASSRAVSNFLDVANNCKDPYIKAEAWYRLAKIYLQKEALRDQARDYLVKASHQESNLCIKAIAYVYLGRLAKQQVQTGSISATKEALEFYEKARNQKVNKSAKAEADYESARLYEKGDWDVPKNFQKVFSFDKEAAEQLSSETIRCKALLSLGLQYYNGTPSVSIDLVQALKCFQGLEESCQDFRLLEEAWMRSANMYKQGLGGISKSEKKSVEYYKKIQARGSNKAYVHQATLEIGEAALMRGDSNEAETYLNFARTLTEVSEVQRKAKLLYAQLSKDGGDPDE